jgi:hypothetical protein
MAEAVLGMAGSIASGYFGALEAKNQAKIALYNSRVEEQAARTAELVGEYKSRQQAEASARQQSSLEAGLGTSGAVTTVGSPLLIQAKQASENELSNLMIGYETQIEAEQHRNQAKLDLLQMKILRKSAKYKMIAGFMGAGGYAAQGYSQYRTATQPSGWNQSTSTGGGWQWGTSSSPSSGGGSSGWAGGNVSPYGNIA